MGVWGNEGRRISARDPGALKIKSPPQEGVFRVSPFEAIGLDDWGGHIARKEVHYLSAQGILISISPTINLLLELSLDNISKTGRTRFGTIGQ